MSSQSPIGLPGRLPGYVEQRYAGAQARCLDAAWIHTAGAAPRPHRLPPFWEPSLGLCRVIGPDGSTTECTPLLFGPAQTSRVYEPVAGAQMIAVRLQPEIAARLMGEHPRDHVDAKTALAGHDLLDAARRLAGDGAPAEAVAAALSASLRRASDDHDAPIDAISHAARLIRASAGRLRMDRLADHLDIAGRTLRRRFTDRLGLSPKAYSGTVRLNALIQAADGMARPDWAELAYSYGFTDQAHMSGEVARLTGLSPARLHAERTGLAEISKTAEPRAA